MRHRVSTKRAGQTLIEVVIATMIAAMTTIAVFSVILSSFVSQKKADKKELSAMLLKQAQQTLQTFVTVDYNNYSPTPGGKWSADSNGGWALSAGHHDISSLMPADLVTNSDGTACGAACFFSYDVTDDNSPNCVGALGATTTYACKTVTFNMKYAD